jgi:lysozyme family protein
VADFSASIALVLVNEGGDRYTENPLDKGGPTRFGIRLDTLSAFRKKAVTAADVKALTEAEARAIYQANYWAPLGCAQFGNQSLATAVLDAGVLTGISNSARMLQACVGVAVDGQIGPKTIAAVNGAVSGTVLAAFSQKLQAYLVAIVQRDASQVAFLVGWLKRAAVMQALPFLLG